MTYQHDREPAVVASTRVQNDNVQNVSDDFHAISDVCLFVLHEERRF